VKVICCVCKKSIKGTMKKKNKVSHGICLVCAVRAHIQRPIFKVNSIMINNFIERRV
jgi:hypothetical protein